jgi:hypothetical protein
LNRNCRPCASKRRQASTHSAAAQEALSTCNTVLVQGLWACEVGCLACYTVALQTSLRNLCDEFLDTASGKLLCRVSRKPCASSTAQEFCAFTSHTQCDTLSTAEALQQRRRDGNCQCATTLVNALFPLTCTDAAVCLHSSGEKTANKLTCCNTYWAERQTEQTSHCTTTQSQANLRSYFTYGFTGSSEWARQHIVKRTNLAWVALYNACTVLLDSTAHILSAKVTQRRANAGHELPRRTAHIGHKPGGVCTLPWFHCGGQPQNFVVSRRR